MSAADPNRVLLVGENSFIRLGSVDSDDYTTTASFWRIVFSPTGTGHVLFLKTDLAGNDLAGNDLAGDGWSIYADNASLARWLQVGIQGMLNTQLADQTLPIVRATFRQSIEDECSAYTEIIRFGQEEIALSWTQLGDPLLIHTSPSVKPGERPNGMCSVFVPAARARLTWNGREAPGRAWPRSREGRPFSTCALALAESWTEAR
jgi:hypothetical protein